MSFHRPIGRACLRGLLLIGACTVAMPVMAMAQAQHTFDIPAQSAAKALQAFGRQSGKQIVFPFDGADAHQAPAINGTLPDNDVLARLVKAAGLIVLSNNGHTIALGLSAAPSGKPAMQGMATKVDGAAPKDAGTSTGVADIIVTAQRTESLASKTPISLTAISGADLQKKGVNDPLTLGEQLPNVSIVSNNGLQISIRGVSSSDNTEKGDPSAAFLVDGVYIARPQAQNVSFFDIKRVEVLRGPQGTLYGRNTTAGVVNVITNAPVHKFEAGFNSTYGTYDTIRTDAMVNVPVNDQFALRFAGAYDHRKSYITPEPTDKYTTGPGRDNLSGRVQALIEPTDKFTVLLQGDYTRMHGLEDRIYQVVGSRYFGPVPAGQPGYTNQPYIANGVSSADLRRLGFVQAGQPFLHAYTWGANANITWDMGFLTATYLGSYREFYRYALTTRTLTNTFNIVDGDYWQNSHELRFATNGTGPFKAQFGAYHFDETSHTLQIGGIVNAFDTKTNSKNLGFFGQATYKLTSSLHLTAGARYSHDNKVRNGITYLPLTGALIQPDNAATSSGKVTWRAGLDYDLSAKTFVYGSVATGYKSGGFNDGCQISAACPSGQTASRLYYSPEQLTAYEAGVKTRFFDGKMTLNLAGFYNDYKNLQVSSTIQVDGAAQLLTQNAANARIKGVELESHIAPTRRNRIDVAMTWLDAEYLDYWPLGVGVAPSYKGKALDRAPRFVASLGYSYALPLPNQASLTLSAQSRYSSEYFIVSQTSGGQFRQPGYTKSNLTLRYEAPGSRYYVAAYVRNIENGIQIASAAISSGRVLVGPTEPRTFGGQLGMKF